MKKLAQLGIAGLLAIGALGAGTSVSSVSAANDDAVCETGELCIYDFTGGGGLQANYSVNVSAYSTKNWFGTASTTDDDTESFNNRKSATVTLCDFGGGCGAGWKRTRAAGLGLIDFSVFYAAGNNDLSRHCFSGSC